MDGKNNGKPSLWPYEQMDDFGGGPTPSFGFNTQIWNEPLNPGNP